MLSISVISSAGGLSNYYEKDSGQSDYWNREAEESTKWQGRGAEDLGLVGPVKPQDFQALMEGRLPDGQQMPHGAGGERRAGYDLTFSAPKSVSLAGIVGRDDRVLAAHDEAVGKALDYLERETAQTRIKEAGEIRVEKTANLTAAVFRHSMSRNLDPQLHSHCVIANVTRDANGQWRALSSEEVFKHKMAAGAIYRAELGVRMKAYGYNLRQTRHGFEIREISDKNIRSFSTRRQEIETRLTAVNQVGAKASEVAALATRQAKQVLDSEQSGRQFETWRKTAEAGGLKNEKSLEHISAEARSKWLHNISQSQRTPDHVVNGEQGGKLVIRKAVNYAVDHLSERQSVFERREILRHAANHGAAHGVDLKRIETEIETQLKARQLIMAGERFTTTEALKREIQAVQIMRHGRGQMQAISNREQVNRLAEGLTNGQREALRLTLTTKDQVVGIEGKAGSGKTTMLKRVVQAAQAQGYNVRGLAPSAQAAKVLENETGAKAQTLSRHLMEQPQTGGREIWVVDEAGMMSAKQAHKLLLQVRSSGARVVLVGDRQQLASIEAGKPLAVLADKGMKVARMDQIVRQNNQQLKQAIEKIIEHKGREAVQDLSGSIKQIENREERLESVAKSYLSHSGPERRGTMVIVETNRDRRELNQMVRNGLRREGQLHGERLEATQLVKENMTRAEMRMVHNYEEGMQVRFGRNYKSLDVQRGETLEVKGIDPQKNVVQLQVKGGREITWNPARTAKVEVFREQQSDLQTGDQIRFTRNEYGLGRINGHTAQVVSVNGEERVAQIKMTNGEEQTIKLDEAREQTWTHGYASTVHASQGATADRAIIAVDTEQGMASEQSIYVGVSRAREGVEIMTDNEQKLGEFAGKEAMQESAIEAVEDSGQSVEGRLTQDYHSGQTTSVEQDQQQEM